jgi:hypothetical protein
MQHATAAARNELSDRSDVLRLTGAPSLIFSFLLLTMAKSLRCKAKNAARRHKRETGEYHIHHAARLDRINARLLSGNSNKEVIGQEAAEQEVEDEVLAEGEEKMTGEYSLLCVLTGVGELGRQGARTGRGAG